MDAPTTISEPEREVYHRIDPKDNETSSRQGGPSSIITDDSSHYSESDDEFHSNLALELNSQHSWSDFSFNFDGREEGIKESICAIRKEASLLDSMLAMDHIAELKQELDAAKKQLTKKNTELQRQKGLMKMKDERLATLELERDLYKADANKLKADLQICIEQMGSSSSSSTLTSLPSQDHHEIERTIDHVYREVADHVMLVPHLGLPDFSVDGTMLYEDQQRKRPPMPTSRPPLPPSLGSRKNLASAIASRKLSHEARPDKRSPSKPSIRRMMGLKTGLSSDSHVQEVELTELTLETQVHDLQRRLVVSMRTAAELRNRLALVSSHYESVVYRLNARLTATKAQLRHLEEELEHQVASINLAKSVAIKALERKLDARNDEIKRLRFMK